MSAKPAVVLRSREVASAPGRSTFVMSGEVVVGRAPGVLSTVLGSCVAVCLWDGSAGLGGLNHYQLPREQPGGGSCRWGNTATERLIEQVLAAGASRARLQAKVFGGAASGKSRWNVGADNILVAWEVLTRQGIPVVASDVGGMCCRQLSFDVGTGQVQIRWVASQPVVFTGGR